MCSPVLCSVHDSRHDSTSPIFGIITSLGAKIYFYRHQPGRYKASLRSRVNCRMLLCSVQKYSPRALPEITPWARCSLLQRVKHIPCDLLSSPSYKTNHRSTLTRLEWSYQSPLLYFSQFRWPCATWFESWMKLSFK